MYSNNLRLMEKYIFEFFIILLFFLTLSICIIFEILNIENAILVFLLFLGFYPMVKAFLTNTDVFSPAILMPATYTLYALGPLIEQRSFPPEIYIKYLILQLIGLLSMQGGIYFGKRSKKVIKNNMYYDFIMKERKLLLTTAVLLIFFALPSILTQIYAFGGFSNFLRVGYGGQRYIIFESSFIFGTGFEWLLLGAIILVVFGIKYSSKLILMCGGILYITTVVILLKIGARGIIISSILFGAVLYNYLIKKISNRIAILGILIGISIAQYYALARFYLPQGLFYALYKTYKGIVQNPNLILPWAANEFRMPAMSLMEILQYADTTRVYGASYLGAISRIFPFVSRLFNKIIFNPSIWRLETFYPDILAQGGGLGFSPVAEGYLNFGILGVVLHLFLYGFIIGKIYKLAETKNSFLWILFYAGSIPVFMLTGMRINSSTFVYQWIRTYLMPFFIFFLVKTYSKKVKEGTK